MPGWAQALQRPSSSRGAAAAPRCLALPGGLEVNPPDVLRGHRALAAPARHGRGFLLLGQAGAAQEVAAGELVNGLRLEVGREGFAAGGAPLALAAPAVLCEGRREAAGWPETKGGARISRPQGGFCLSAMITGRLWLVGEGFVLRRGWLKAALAPSGF